MIRRRAVQRLTSALIGAAIAALGCVTIAALNGRDLDFELVTIIGLGTAGLWLLLTAAAASVRKPKRPEPFAAKDPDADDDEPPTDIDAARTVAQTIADRD